MQHENGQAPSRILTIRSYSGISGDMLTAGLASLQAQLMGLRPDSAEATAWLDALASGIMPELAGSLRLIRHQVNGIGGWQAQVDLPKTNIGRHLHDILAIIAQAGLSEKAREKAQNCFQLLADCEADVHDSSPAQIHFHEVGALDSILDICAVCALYVEIGSPRIVCAPLPLADGQIYCAHGWLPSPAPAVLQLLEGMPVCAFSGRHNVGELLTPTGVALLRALNAEFGPWPEFTIQKTAIVYGQRVFPGAANGVIFAIGLPQ